MREDILRELEEDYSRIRSENERTEQLHREEIRRDQPEINRMVQERENLVFGTLRSILNKESTNTESLPERIRKLSADIRVKLMEKGYAPDYLAPVYRCPVCEDRGWTGEPVREPCSCLKKAYQQKIRERIGLSNKQRESFENFDLNVFSAEKLPGKRYSQREQMQMFRELCEEWASHYPDSACRDLLLSGASGLGKTFLLHAMAEKLIERDISVLLVSAYRLIDILRRVYFSNDNVDEEIMKAEVLMIDDLGSEPLMQNVTVEQLFNLLNERQSRNLSTVISTNLNLAEFRNRYTERTASRLMDRRFCRVLTLEGTDIRTGGARRE